MFAVLEEAFARRPRARLATLPTALERGPQLPGGARLWIKRDDLTGLGGGGNKARKLEFLCGLARRDAASCLITVGAPQSNHCRMTAAAGAVLGLDVHLILAGDAPLPPTGNLVLDGLFGAHLHFTGGDERLWGELEIARDELTEQLQAAGERPFSIGIGGSSPVGALGYVDAYFELMDDCARLGIDPMAIVHTTSSGGTHAGLLAGRALAEAFDDRATSGSYPAVIPIGVAKGVLHGVPDIAHLAASTIELLIGDDGARCGAALEVLAGLDTGVDDRWMGDDYGVPTPAGDEAIRWAARHGGWILDRTYAGKGFSGLLGAARSGRFGPGDDVVFIHTGGIPAVFAPGGAPLP